MTARTPVTWRDNAEELNASLHRMIDAEPCETACTHRLTSRWTMLGVANVAARNGFRAPIHITIEPGER